MLIESLEHLLDINSKVLELGEIEISEIVANLSSNRKIPALLFALNSFLIEATQSDKVRFYKDHILNLIHQSFHEEITFSCFLESPQNNLKNFILKKYILFDLKKDADLLEPSQSDFERAKFLISQALNLIKQSKMDFYLELLDFVSEFMIFKSDALKAGSSFDLFGMIYINANNSKYSVINMAETIIHETAHLYLYALGTEDSLVLNNYEEKYFSPIKGYDRPMLGIYHAAFVLTRVLMFLTEIKQLTQINSQEMTEIDFLIEKYRKIVEDSLKIIDSFGRLTNLGESLIRNTANLFQKIFEESPELL